MFFALLPQVNVPANNLTFRWSWWDQIQAIFLNLFYFNDSFLNFRVTLKTKKVLRRIDNQRKSEINQLENFSEPFLMKILVQPNEPIVGFWCQIIVQKLL